MQSTLLVTDPDPQFDGWAGLINGKRMVCVMPADLVTDTERRQSLREIVRRGGGDCDSCRNCHIGNDS
ncbi:hypothetical protein C9F11_37835 [Streptomyces sp. YIM 121038]|nr:hypothetical protein C9F11_37835 [Streptomyces sp. YIM 121038]